MTDDDRHDDEGVPLPPVPDAARRPRQSRSGTRTSSSGNSRLILPDDASEAPAARKNPLGRLVLVSLLGLAVLFGIGYAIGSLFDSGSSSGANPSDCQTTETMPSYLPPAQVNVDVLNAGAPPGTAGKTAEALGGFGFVVGEVDNGASDATAYEAVIKYGPDGKPAAETLAAYLKGKSLLQSDPTLTGSVNLLLLSSFSGVESAADMEVKLTKPVVTTTGPGCPTPSAPAPASAPASEPAPAP